MGIFEVAKMANTSFYGGFSVAMLYSVTTVCGDWIPIFDWSALSSTSCIDDVKTQVDLMAHFLGMITLLWLGGVWFMGADIKIFQTQATIFTIGCLWPEAIWTFYQPVADTVLCKVLFGYLCLVMVPVNIAAYRAVTSKKENYTPINT